MKIVTNSDLQLVKIKKGQFNPYYIVDMVFATEKAAQRNAEKLSKQLGQKIQVVFRKYNGIEGGSYKLVAERPIV